MGRQAGAGARGFGSGFTVQLSRRLGDDELAVAVLCNRVGIRLGKMARDIMAIYEPELALNEKPIEDKEPGTLVESDFAFLWSGFSQKGMHDFAGWKAGRPTKYEPDTIDRLLAGLADGLSH